MVLLRARAILLSTIICSVLVVLLLQSKLPSNITFKQKLRPYLTDKLIEQRKFQDLNHFLKNITHYQDVHEFLNFRVQLAQKANLSLLTYGSNQACYQMMTKAADLWVSVDNVSMTSEQDHARMTTLVNCGGQWIHQYLKTPPKAEWYNFEREYLLGKPLIDVRQASSGVFSTVLLLNDSNKFVVGDTVGLKLTVKDGYNVTKHKGGDEVRSWLVDTQHNSKLALLVSDLNNGTYLISSILPWSGKLRIYVELTYTREFFSVLMTSHLLIKGYQQTIGGFVNKNISEGTACFNTPVLPGYTEDKICNLTLQNGSPWFCGRPVKAQLTCEDYKLTRLLVNTADAPLLTTELDILKNIRFVLIGQHIFIEVQPRDGKIKRFYQLRISKLNELNENYSKQTCLAGKCIHSPGINKSTESQSRIVPSLPCHLVPIRQTWEQSEPTGYFYNNKWQSLICSPSPTYDEGCNKNVELLFLGDSNLRGHYYAITDHIKCEHVMKAEYEKWHKPLLCVNRATSFIIRWYPHSNPFKTYATKWADPLNDLIPSNVAIDKISSTGRYIVVLNHHLHVTGQHISAYMDLMLAIRDSLARAWKRNPNITVVLQGPHIVIKEGSYRGGDILNRFIIHIHKTVFSDFKDRILYYPVSDMSIAARNQMSHPENDVRMDWTKYLLAFMCNR